MSSMQSNSSANVTFVRPATFFLIGFSNIPHVKYYYVFLFFVYTQKKKLLNELKKIYDGVLVPHKKIKKI